jgi:hypothetical protein
LIEGVVEISWSGGATRRMATNSRFALSRGDLDIAAGLFSRGAGMRERRAPLIEIPKWKITSDYPEPAPS